MGKTDEKKRFSGTCNYCKKVGHMVADCRKLKFKEKVKKETDKKSEEVK
jgi:hypothetical protein